MPKVTRIYSRYTQDAASLLGKLVKLGRKQRKLTAQDLAERAGISRGLLQRIENGNPRCEIGVVFEVAALVGVKLFDADSTALISHNDSIDDKLALLPKAVHGRNRLLDDDF